MTVKVGINGFGRIGRLALRAALESSDVEVLAINDIAKVDLLAHLFKYDSVHGTYCGDVAVEGDNLVIDGKKVRVTAEKDPAQLPWKELGVEYVIESTGKFRKGPDAKKHIEAGASKVVISAPGKEICGTFVMGVNEDTYDPGKHTIVSNASCTTNCLAPVAKVLLEKFGLVRGLMTTIHAYTNDQNTLDAPHKDYRRARAAALSMIPTTTGAAAAVGLVLPELKGKLNGMAMRVPTPNVSVVDLVAELEQDASEDDINNAMKTASEGDLKGILDYCDEPLVTTDFNHTSASAIFDSLCTTIIDKKLVKVIAYYDNEWAYSKRLIDLIEYMAKK